MTVKFYLITITPHAKLESTHFENYKIPKTGSYKYTF